MRIKLISFILTAVLGVILYLIVQSGDQNTEPKPSQVPSSDHNQVSSKAPLMQQQLQWQPPQLMAETYESDYGPLPPSLRGTRIPFDIRVDEQNHLIIDSTLRRLFDYFFTLVGEEEVALIKQRIEEILIRYLPDPARQQALDIFHQYVELKESEIALREQMAADYVATGQPVDLYERVRLLREMRQSLLSPEVYDAFFAEEDKRALYSLERHAILQDESLILQERNDALRALDQQLPESLRAAKEEEYLANELMVEIEKARQRGATAAEIFQMRSEVYGAQAAERFAQADKKQQEWDQRVARYREQRQQILASSLSEEDQAAEIERLRQQHFSGPELLRIPVIDSMYDEQGKP